jgi:GH3 auxin-responsive promoter
MAHGKQRIGWHAVKTLLVNCAWYCSALPGYLAFQRGVRNVQRTQIRRMLSLVKMAAKTEYGQKYDFASITSLEAFRERVPIVEYQDLQSYIEAIAAGQTNVLFPGLPWCFEPTSGTSSANKLIPYTKALHQEFQAGITPWIFAMFTRNPGLMKGPAYWSISPVNQQEKFTSGGIPIGFQDDTAYLNRFMRHAMKYIMAVPSEVTASATIDEFYLHTIQHLLEAKHLALISVWNPSFLTMLLETLYNNAAALIDKVETVNPVRAEELRAIIDIDALTPASYTKIWPKLKVISCWSDAAAAIPAQQLKERFPGVKIIPKGLIATEGFITLPLEGLAAPALAVNSHFYEFIPVDQPDEIVNAWELESGRRYSVVITTGGGLYRYKLHDMVQVKGFYRQCPLLEFIGRDNATSDICGEKLHEALVMECLQEVFASVLPGFSLLAPEDNGGNQSDRYVLYLTGCNHLSLANLEEKQQQFDQLLCRNFHYAYCRKLGQLKAVKFTVLSISQEQAMQQYIAASTVSGQKIGDIKPAALSNKSGWNKILSNQ